MKTADEILAENNKLTADFSTAQTEIANLKAASASEKAALISERDSAKAELVTAKSNFAAQTANLAIVTGERDSAKAELVTAKAAVTDFEGKVAAAIAKHGINPKAVSPESQPEGQKNKLSITEQCLAAKGLPMNFISASGGCGPSQATQATS